VNNKYYVDAYYVICYNPFESAFIKTLSLIILIFHYASGHTTKLE